jgi:hypothetical protein
LAHIAPSIFVFKTLKVPVSGNIVDFKGPSREDVIRVDPCFRGELWRDDVSVTEYVQGGRVVWYAQVQLLFHIDVCSTRDAQEASRQGRPPQRTARHSLAFVRWFDDAFCRERDETSYQRLHWAAPANGDYGVIHIDSIRKLEHIVPDFNAEDGERFYVNHFAFVHQRRAF